jgi:hypothetical protein
MNARLIIGKSMDRHSYRAFRHRPVVVPAGPAIPVRRQTQGPTDPRWGSLCGLCGSDEGRPLWLLDVPLFQQPGVPTLGSHLARLLRRHDDGGNGHLGGRRLPTSPAGGLAYTMRGGLSSVMAVRYRGGAAVRTCCGRGPVRPSPEQEERHIRRRQSRIWGQSHTPPSVVNDFCCQACTGISNIELSLRSRG